ncbi:MAG: SurA N-terminal domain-containing protein [Deltaproteobacteria bacterium]|nr:SurA N-terminal domain-containing protein [Deltaproteobacteria bacterium]
MNAVWALALLAPLAREPMDSVAAVVERRVITLSEVEAEARLALLLRAEPGSDQPELPRGALDDQLRQAVLQTMVAHELLALEARRRGLVVREADVDAAVTQVKARFAGPEAARAWLARAAIDEELLRGRARRDLLAAAHLQGALAELKVSDEEARAYLEIDIELAADRPLLERLAAARAALLTARREERTAQLVAEIGRGVDVRLVSANSPAAPPAPPPSPPPVPAAPAAPAP